MFKIRLLVLLSLVISNKIFSSDASKNIQIYLIEITEDDVNKVERCVQKFKKGDHSELTALPKNYFYDKYIFDKDYNRYISFLIKENFNMPNSYAQFLEMVKEKLSLDTFYIYDISYKYELGMPIGTISGSAYGLNSYKVLCKNGEGFHKIIDSDMKCNLINTLKDYLKNSPEFFIFYSRKQIIENSVKTQNGKKNKKCCCC